MTVPLFAYTHTDTDPSIPLVISRHLPRVQCNAICLSHSPVPSRQLGLQRFLLPTSLSPLAAIFTPQGPKTEYDIYTTETEENVRLL